MSTPKLIITKLRNFLDPSHMTNCVAWWLHLISLTFQTQENVEVSKVNLFFNEIDDSIAELRYCTKGIKMKMTYLFFFHF